MRHNLVQIELRCREQNLRIPSARDAATCVASNRSLSSCANAVTNLIAELEQKLRRGRVIAIDIR